MLGAGSALFAGTLLRLAAGDEFRAGTAAGVCRLGACAADVVALAGWCAALVPTVYGLAFAALFRRMGTVARALGAVGAGLLVVAVVPFLPWFDGVPYDDTVGGPGGAAFALGLRFGAGSALGLLIAAGLAWLVARRTPVRAREVALYASLPLFLVATFAAAEAKALPDPLMTWEIFPEPRLDLPGGVLTRQSATDLVGCEALFEDCDRTAAFDFSTSDSEALVHFRVIAFGTEEAAGRAARRGVPTPRPRTEVIVVEQAARWVLVSTVRLAGDRPVVPGESRWMRWPAAQLAYAFHDIVGTGAGVAPRRSAELAPKTP